MNGTTDKKLRKKNEAWWLYEVQQAPFRTRAGWARGRGKGARSAIAAASLCYAPIA